MHKVQRALGIALVSLVLGTLSVSAAPRGDRDRDVPARDRIVKVLKFLVQSLGDTLVIPKP